MCFQSINSYKHIIEKIKYRAKFFPEEVDDLIEEITIRYIYLQVRSHILTDRLYCPADTCTLLASYASQARHGDYNPDIHNEAFLSREKLLPQRYVILSFPFHNDNN